MEHGQGQARRLLGAGLLALGMKGHDLQQEAKGMAEKEILAWWLCRRTTVSRRWVSEQLDMGHESRVSLAIRRVQAAADPHLAKLRGQIEQQAATLGESSL